jgi:hypothetical protein
MIGPNHAAIILHAPYATRLLQYEDHTKLIFERGKEPVIVAWLEALIEQIKNPIPQFAPNAVYATCSKCGGKGNLTVGSQLMVCGSCVGTGREGGLKAVPVAPEPVRVADTMPPSANVPEFSIDDMTQKPPEHGYVIREKL